MNQKVKSVNFSIIGNISEVTKGNSVKKLNSGVWALYGQSKVDKTWKCLQVGQSKDIKKEIIVDAKLLVKTKPKSVKKDYINQFAEHCFTYDEYPNMREVLYYDIASKFKDLIFVLISNSEDEKKRKDIEKKFAWASHAKYWRNGCAFKNEISNYYNETYKKNKDKLKKYEKLHTGILENICAKYKNKTLKKLLSIKNK